MGTKKRLTDAAQLLDELRALISKHMIVEAGRVEPGWELFGFIDALAGDVNQIMRKDADNGENYVDGMLTALALKEKGLPKKR